MQFGHFLYPMKFDDTRDDQEIDQCLDEAVLAEKLGMDAIWFAEHYFTGECVYGDPLVFASAVAVKTSRIKLGFGIIELPLHNPVRIAHQTALLDNLSKGRLMVGTGRGSTNNAYEYVGFGTEPGLGKRQLEEAEELLIKAWTTDNVKFDGEFWKVAFPSVRPRPFQKPHPPLSRAASTLPSVIEMAKIGRPVLIRGGTFDATAEQIVAYRDNMSESGFSDEAVQNNLDQIWVWREMHIADTNDQAWDEYLPAHYKAYEHMEAVRREWNPDGMEMNIQRPPMKREGYGKIPNPSVGELLIGGPERVADQIAMMRDMGIKNLMLTNRGLISKENTVKSLRLLNEKITPKFRVD